MKTIELKVLKEGEFTIDYRAQLLSCVRVPMASERGMDIEEMRKSIRVIEALEKPTLDELKNQNWVDFEDADYEHLKQKVSAMRWNLAHRFIVQFVDDVNAAPDMKKAR